MATLTLLFSKEEIDTRLDALAKEINAEYAGKELVLVCVLKGAIVFFSELLRRLDFDVEVGFVRVASYGLHGMESSNQVQLLQDIEYGEGELAGKHVLFVEDIVDTGQSMQHLFAHFAKKKPESIKLVGLVDKYGRRQVEIHTDFVGFRMEDAFVVGYGMDYMERYRNLPAVYTLSLD